jgi:hypothetical protein
MNSGDQVVVLVEGHSIKGVIVSDDERVLVLADCKNLDVRIFVTKAKIGAIITSGAKKEDKPDEKIVVAQRPIDDFVVLACSCEKIKCKGVKYIKHGSGASQNDFTGFMGRCKKNSTACKRISLGPLINAPLAELKVVLDNTIFGDYPE